MTVFRVYYATRGQHVHCRVFSGDGVNSAMCGKLVMKVDEFEALVAAVPWTGGDPAEAPAQFYFVTEAGDGSSDKTADVVSEWLGLPTGLRTQERLLEMLR